MTTNFGHEVQWWFNHLQARQGGGTTSSGSSKRERRCFRTAAAAVCMAGMVVISVAWTSWVKRFRSQSRANQEPADGRTTTGRQATSPLRETGPSPEIARRDDPPLLLLCAAPDETAPMEEGVREGRALVPFITPSPWTVALTDSFCLSDIPMIVGVDDETGELMVRAVVDIDTEPAGTDTIIRRDDPPLLLLCAAPDETAPMEEGVREGRALVPFITPSPWTVALTDSFCLSDIPMIVGVDDETGELMVRAMVDIDTEPAGNDAIIRRDDPPLLLLCAGAAQEETPPSAQTTAVTHAPTPAPATSSPSLATTSDRLIEVSPPIDEANPHPTLPLLPAAGPNSAALPPAQPLEGKKGGGSLGRHVAAAAAAAAHAGRGVTIGGDLDTTASTLRLDSPSQARRLASSSPPPASSRGGRKGLPMRLDVRVLPGRNHHDAAVGGRTSIRSSTWGLGKARRGPTSPEVTGASVPSGRGGGGQSGAAPALEGAPAAAGAAGGGSAALPRGAVWALGEAAAAAAVAGGGSAAPSRSALWALPGQNRSSAAAARGRADFRSSTWALGKARRGSISPEVMGKSVRSSRRGSGGRSGTVPSLESAAAADVGASSSSSSSSSPSPSPAPRSILVTSRGCTSARRAAAVSRGVRWLDTVRKEEEQAKNRRLRAARWTGSGGSGGKKRELPPTAAPRPSRAMMFAREG